MSGFAISGKAGSGKTTFAGKLLEACERAGLPAVKIAFGDELKREVWELYGIDKYMVGGRDALIRHGEKMREADPDYWIRPVAERVRLAQVSGVIVVIDDMRFAREYEWARDAGLVAVRMVASPEWRAQKLAQQGLWAGFVDSKEPGECQLDGFRFNHVVRNFAGATLDERAATLVASVV